MALRDWQLKQLNKEGLIQAYLDLVSETDRLRTTQNQVVESRKREVEALVNAARAGGYIDRVRDEAVTVKKVKHSDGRVEFRVIRLNDPYNDGVSW